MRLIKDTNKAEDVNEQLFVMGKNIGGKIIDDFLAKSRIDTCKSFRDTIDVVSKVR